MTPEDAFYKCFKDNKRNKDLELLIIKDPEYAFYYANYVIKSRWLEAENIIATSSLYAYLYALDVVKDKLPENMHNAMLIYADCYAKDYFNYIKNKPQP